MKADKPTPIREPEAGPQSVTVVAVPIDLYGEMIARLTKMPYDEISSLMGKLGQLQPQSVELRKG